MPDPTASSQEALETELKTDAPAPEAEAAPPSPEEILPAETEKRRLYNFRSPSLINTAEMRKLKLRHEEFARSLATRLAIYLRMDFDIKIAELKTLPCREWMVTLPSPTHVTSFQIETLKGTGLVQMSPILALTMVDRLLGGPGESVTPTRDLTEIEVVLADEAIQLVLREWCPQMPLAAGAKPSLIGHETNVRFLQPVADDVPLMVVTLQVGMNTLSETIQLAFPFSMLEPMIRSLAPAPMAPAPTKPAEQRHGLKWNPGLADVKVRLTAEWAEFDIPAGRLAGLKVGDTLELDADCVNNVQVRLARVTKFVGRLGTRGKARAIQLTTTTKI